MFRLITIFIYLLTSHLASAQITKSIGITVTGRYDKHANSISNYGGRAYNDTNRLYGYSYGISATLKRQVYKNYSVYIGIGYYRLGVDKIRGPLPFNIPGTRTARNIDYDDGMTSLLYSTSRYHYNNIAVTIGVEREILLNNKLRLTLAAEGIGYKTVSQKYQLFSGSSHYTTHNNKPIEFGVNINPGIIKNFERFYFNPSLVIPVYQNLKGDKVFFEDPKMNISKWFSGIGLSVKIGKYF